MNFFKLAFYSACLFSFGLIAENNDFVVNLKDPNFTQGILSTDKGGVIKSEGIRIQAQKIEYIDRTEDGLHIQKVIAEGDLLLEYSNQAFIGEKLEYDFVNHTGEVLKARTFTGLWYLGGEKVELTSDGSYTIQDAYITTSDNKNASWSASANLLKITKNKILTAKNIRFKLASFPLFWLPSFKSNLKFFSSSPIKYKITWDKGLGPRATARYRIYSSENTDVFLRADYRLEKGFGAALETENRSDDDRSLFITKSYLSADGVIPKTTGHKRYRLQGLIRSKSIDEKTNVFLCYDKLSDDKMPTDFKDDDFVVGTEKRTIFRLNQMWQDATTSLIAQPKINTFQTILQQLPMAAIAIRPINLANTGLISENTFKAGYLDYVYANGIKDLLPHIHSTKLETQNRLYLPIPMKSFTLTPNAQFLGIFYDNSPNTSDYATQAILTYGVEAKTFGSRSYSKYSHLLEPYVAYKGSTEPKLNNNQHYIFSLDDGQCHLDLLKLGFRNSFYPLVSSPLFPSFSADFYTWGFLNNKNAYNKTFPKVYADLEWSFPSLFIGSYSAWNIAENLLDYSNLRTDYTVDENIAFGFEFRHRSKFDFRKSDKENFDLEIVRELEDLLLSPLADGRDTFITKLHFRLTPKWSCHFESHHGWGRKDEPRYNAEKIDLLTNITENWLLRLSYEFTPSESRFTWSLRLL